MRPERILISRHGLRHGDGKLAESARCFAYSPAVEADAPCALNAENETTTANATETRDVIGFNDLLEVLIAGFCSTGTDDAPLVGRFSEQGR
jgi:hypothetical protein